MKLVRYCPVERRLWIATQRCHHGVVGIILCVSGIVMIDKGAVGCLAIVLGALLIVHDRKDYKVWFAREKGTVG
jgi:hypothetical protein